MTCRHKSSSNAKHEERLTGGLRPIPKWQAERARRLHHKFLRAEKALAAGATLRKVFSHFAWYWRHRKYRSNRKRQVQFGFKTLIRLYYQWQKGGRTKETLRLNYRSGYQRAPENLLLELVDFCTAPRTMSLLAAWNEFVARRPLPPPVTYSAILRYFDSSKFRAIQSELRAMARAEKSLARLVADVKRGIRAHYRKGGRV